MEIDDTTKKYLEIFEPGALEEYQNVLARNTRFAYYTSADTAMKVLQSEELWFRNAMVMNDFFEISYGLELIQRTFSGPAGERFREAVDDISERAIESVNPAYSWKSAGLVACA